MISDRKKRSGPALSKRAMLHYLGGGAAWLAAGPILGRSRAFAAPAPKDDGAFRIWASSCSHVLMDIDPHVYRTAGRARESIGEAIRQSEGTNNDGAPSFDWDIGLHLGDFSISGRNPSEAEGMEVVRQFAALRKHRREDFYCLAGNHDASEGQQWFQKWIDPLGQNSGFSGVHAEQRLYPVTGSWERYEFQAGNILFLMMSDRNDLPPPAGRGGGSAVAGGHPAGSVTKETFEWWKDRVLSNQDKIIVTACHHMLRGTTVATEPWEGLGVSSEKEWKQLYPEGPPELGGPINHLSDHRYHGASGNLADKGSSYLFFLDEQPEAEAFERFLAANPGAIDIWLGGHTHIHPDEMVNGRSAVETRWGAHFINVAALSAYWGRTRRPPISRLLSFAPNSRELRVQCYLHDDFVAPRGWYQRQEKVLNLRKAFTGKAI